ncbi:hypothetical protein PACTADRAFT_51293, partial [Pachysolen tannophilus NRRL Y-2460]
MSEEFIVVRRSKWQSQSNSKYCSVTKNIDSLYIEFCDKLELLANSFFYKETILILNKIKFEPKITNIRCLTIGSISQDSAALYQLCYLKLLADFFQLSGEKISIFDPIFTNLDSKFLIEKLGFKIDKNSNFADFYFMPHAPIVLIEEILIKDKPKFMLTNDISIYNDKWSDYELYEKYPNIALLKNCIQNNKDNEQEKQSNGFQIYHSKKKLKKKNLVHIEPTINYNYQDCFFTKCTKLQFIQNNEQLYGNSFSDMAIHII